MFSLPAFNQQKELYKKFITSADYDELYKWEALKVFQDNWDIEAEDFRYMFDASFSHKEGSNLWAGTHWYPKMVMQQFIGHDKERVRGMFRDLYTDEQDIDKRIDRFVFHCDEMREEMAANDPSMKNHFHDGQRIISLYLSFRYPESYAIYKFTEFRKFMEIVHALDIPGTGEYRRFVKIINTINTRLKMDEELMLIHQSMLNDRCYQGETLMLAQDFVFRTARRFME